MMVLPNSQVVTWSDYVRNVGGISTFLFWWSDVDL